MIGFQISVNSKQLYTVAVGEIGKIIAQMEWTNGKTLGGETQNSMWVGARAHSPSFGNHRHWQCRELKIGDEVTIRVVDTDTSDPPLPAGTLPDYPELRRGPNSGQPPQ